MGFPSVPTSIPLTLDSPHSSLQGGVQRNSLRKHCLKNARPLGFFLGLQAGSHSKHCGSLAITDGMFESLPKELWPVDLNKMHCAQLLCSSLRKESCWPGSILWQPFCSFSLQHSCPASHKISQEQDQNTFFVCVGEKKINILALTLEIKEKRWCLAQLQFYQ